MTDTAIRSNWLRNLIQTAVLLGGMCGLLALVGWALAGPAGLVWAAGAGLAASLMGMGPTADILLKLYRAREVRLPPGEPLQAVLSELAQRAGLAAPPALYLIPSGMLQAFSVQLGQGPAIAITEGLLHDMSAREAAAVLAHEIGHIVHRDTRIMALADMMTKLTRLLAWAGWMTLFVTLPLQIAGVETVRWEVVVLLIFAPSLSALLQLGLSRTREFDADLLAARLTGDPDALAKALIRLERYQGRMWEQLLLPGYRLPEPSLLRTHPATDDRVRRLVALPAGETLRSLRAGAASGSRRAGPDRRPPRWRLSGLWY